MEGMRLRTSNTPFAARGPEVVWYAVLFCLKEFAAEYKNGFDDAVNILRWRCVSPCDGLEDVRKLPIVSTQASDFVER
jgi:hypothetical protein